MSAFNEHLSDFLIECRNDAWDGLRTDSRYIEQASKLSELRSKLDSLLSPDDRAILEKYSEALNAIRSMESNTALLCGLTLQTNILRRFDMSAPEYKLLFETFM